MLVKAPWGVLFVTWDFSLMLGISLKVPCAVELHRELVCVFCAVPFVTSCKVLKGLLLHVYLGAPVSCLVVQCLFPLFISSSPVILS